MSIFHDRLGVDATKPLQPCLSLATAVRARHAEASALAKAERGVVSGRARGRDSCCSLPVADVVKGLASLGTTPMHRPSGGVRRAKQIDHGDATASRPYKDVRRPARRQGDQGASRTPLLRTASQPLELGMSNQAAWRRRSRSPPQAAFGDSASSGRRNAAPATPPQGHQWRTLCERLPSDHRWRGGCRYCSPENPAVRPLPTFTTPAPEASCLAIDRDSPPRAAKEPSSQHVCRCPTRAIPTAV